MVATSIERVSSFKYLGVYLSEDLTWNTHIQHKTTKARKHASLIFRRFYVHSNPQCLKQLYMSFVWPHLEYAVPVWSPISPTKLPLLKNAQKFVLRMCHKAWREQYTLLLDRFGLQSLADRRKLLDICYLYRLITGKFMFNDAPLEPRDPDPRLRSFNPHQLCQPFAITSAFKNSYFSRAISYWNLLPPSAHFYLSVSVVPLISYNLFLLCTHLFVFFLSCP